MEFINYAIAFSIGAVFGYFVRYLIEKLTRNTIINEDLFRLILSFVLVGVFIVAFIVSLFDRTYEIPLAIYPFVGAVVGYYFGAKYLEKRAEKEK